MVFLPLYFSLNKVGATKFEETVVHQKTKMKKYKIFNKLHIIIKYMKENTIISTINKDDGSILFPSVTICKRYWFGLGKSENKNVSALITKYRIHKNVWRKKELFYFVSHSNMFNLSFPCNTMEGTGTTPGKPCSFPHTWGGDYVYLHEGCNDWGNCVTR